MSIEEIQQQINVYFEKNPYASVEQLTAFIIDAKNKAMKMTLPDYKPIEVHVKNNSSYYEEELKKAEIKPMTDESTFAEGGFHDEY
jgi:hypothetical protein